MIAQLVVAKYRENISWVKDMPCEVLVYDKCPSEDRPGGTSISYRNIPNPIMGREAHSYLTHIVENYDDLADATFFVQANPWGHYPWGRHLLGIPIHDTLPFSQYLPHLIPPVCQHDTSFRWAKCVIPCWLGMRRAHGWWTDRWSLLFGGEPPPKTLVFASGAQFAVPRWRILQRPLGYYEYLLRQTEQEPCVIDAWLLECCWLYIFGDTSPQGFPNRLLKTFPRCLL